MLAGRRGEKNILQLINDFDRMHLKTFELQFHGVSVVGDEQLHLKGADDFAHVDSPRFARRTIAEDKLQTVELDQPVDELRKVKKTFDDQSRIFSLPVFSALRRFCLRKVDECERWRIAQTRCAANPEEKTFVFAPRTGKLIPERDGDAR